MKTASIPIKEQLLLKFIAIQAFPQYRFNSYKGTIVIILGYDDFDDLKKSFNSYKGTIVIILKEVSINDIESFNSYKGTIVMGHHG